jgi:hypothetical protein
VFNKLIPESFREIVAVISILLGFLFSFFSLKSSLREHSLRVTGLLLLLGLCLFANNEWCYFAAIFIIATAVTQLDFLQNLAAIIRGSKEYFDYRKEFVSREDVLKSKTKEQEIAEETDKSNSIQTKEDYPNEKGIVEKGVQLEFKKENLTPVHFALFAEELAFKEIEGIYQKQIQRHIRIVGKGAVIEFDGLLELDNMDILYETKVFRQSPFPLTILRKSMKELISHVIEYQAITNKKKRVELTYIIVSSFENETKDKLLDRINQLIEKDINLLSVKIKFEFYSFKQLGLEEIALSVKSR